MTSKVFNNLEYLLFNYSVGALAAAIESADCNFLFNDIYGRWVSANEDQKAIALNALAERKSQIDNPHPDLDTYEDPRALEGVLYNFGWYADELPSFDNLNRSVQKVELETELNKVPLKKTKLEKQQDVIMDVIKMKKMDPMKIPDGEKGTIKDICERDNIDNLFDAHSAFERTWKLGIKKLWQMDNHDSYAKRGKN